jgi:hypothetical protein
MTAVPEGSQRPMPMLSETVDAVVGVDTHRDTHEAEIAAPTGAPIAVCSIDNDTTGYAELLAWSSTTHPARASWWRSRAPAATAPG